MFAGKKPSLCLGEALVDLIAEERLDRPADARAFAVYPGGALANVAVAIRRAGAPAALLGGVGDDPWGSWLRERIGDEDVDTGWVASVEGLPTPLALATFGRDGEPVFQIYGDSISETMAAGARFLEEGVDGAAALVFGSNSLVGAPERDLTIRARRLAREAGLPVLFDPNLRPNRWRDMDRAVAFCRDLCDGAFLVKANAAEAERLTGETDPAGAAEGLCRLGARLGVVTLGPDGALVRGASSGEAPAPGVEVVSTLGAGDSFMGALAAGLAARDWEAERAAEALPGAVEAAAATCEIWGAWS
ncbi:MAG TPA: carbohydrate kinase [Solirubrobacterales bacterium]|nr:carbohydrate kinase [Solirubrobacterales bacterium]